MAKAKKKTTSKPSKRANKYEEKLQVNASFDELAKALGTPKQPLKKK
jgi:hypothetical protein